MPDNPLVEVFGYPVADMSREARSHRLGRLCPFGNPSGPNCTKTSATDPLGVCTIRNGTDLAVTCPIRLRQENVIISDAAEFFFPGRSYVALTEVSLKDINGKAAGNIDIVLAVLDENKKVVDFGAIEVQAVYITGNVGSVFRAYMADPATNYQMDWPRKNYPKPDYLSSSRKRLLPQLLFKGGILNSWGKKTAVIVHRGFFEQLPKLETVDPSEAEMAWFVYDLEVNGTTGRYHLVRSDVRYTRFESALNTISVPVPGEMSKFMSRLESRIKKGRFNGAPSSTPIEPSVEPQARVLEEEAR